MGLSMVSDAGEYPDYYENGWLDCRKSVSKNITRVIVEIIREAGLDTDAEIAVRQVLNEESGEDIIEKLLPRYRRS